MGEQIELLKYHADAFADRLQQSCVTAGVGLRSELQIAHLYAPTVKRLQAVDAPKKDAFPRAGGTDDGVDLARLYIHRDALKHLMLAETL